MVARSDGTFKSNVKQLTGQRFGRLVVIAHSHVKYGTHFWVCQCDCGNTKTVRSALLSNGNTQSCGCLHREKISAELKRRHAAVKHPEGWHTRTWRIWQGMIGRCKYPSHSRWAYYGGRGIAVCDRWQDFTNFWNDVGAIPEGYTLDRIDNDADYSPGNCRLATMKAQAANRRGPFCSRRNDHHGFRNLKCNS